MAFTPFTSTDQVTAAALNRRAKEINDQATSMSSGVSYPVGAVVPFSGAFIPLSWLVCDGAAVSRATYAALFAIVGTTFGAGDGSTTFNLPNLQGQTPVGVGAGAGLTNRVLGSFFGVDKMRLQATHLPSHAHKIPNYTTVNIAGASSGGTDSGNGVTGATGRAGATADGHNTMAPYVGLNMIIRYAA